MIDRVTLERLQSAQLPEILDLLMTVEASLLPCDHAGVMSLNWDPTTAELIIEACPLRKWMGPTTDLGHRLPEANRANNRPDR